LGAAKGIQLKLSANVDGDVEMDQKHYTHQGFQRAYPKYFRDGLWYLVGTFVKY
jgi:hypothetical protein